MMCMRSYEGITDDAREFCGDIPKREMSADVYMQIIVNNLCINGLCAGTCFFVLINLLLILIPRGREKRAIHQSTL